MKKTIVSQNRLRFLRILLWILGWANVIGGVWALISGESNFLSAFLFTEKKPLGSAVMGGVLLLCDLALALFALPQRQEERKNKRAYRAACRSLPGGTGLADLRLQYGQLELNRRTLTDSEFCRGILTRYPCREVLQHIHAHNPQAAYLLSRERISGTKPAEPQVPEITISEKTPDPGQTASRIAGLNALLFEKKEAATVGTPLKKENIQLGPMLDQYWHGCDYYDAANHRVMKYIAIPDGPQGFGPIKVPDEIETLEQLMPWLVENHGFHLKEED